MILKYFFFLFVFNSTSYPSGIINEVENAQTGISERSKLYAELAYYDSEKNKAAGDNIRNYHLEVTHSSQFSTFYPFHI